MNEQKRFEAAEAAFLENDDCAGEFVAAAIALEAANASRERRAPREMVEIDAVGPFFRKMMNNNNK